VNSDERIVGGTYHEGRIVLDRPVKWQEGTRVVVQLVEERRTLIDGVWPADGSPEGEAEILRRMQAAMPCDISQEDAKAFAAVIEDLRRFHKEDMLPAGMKPIT